MDSPGRRPDRPARNRGRPRRAERRGEKHPDQTALPFLRSDPRGDLLGRSGHPRRAAGRTAPSYGRVVPGLHVLRPDCGGEHRRRGTPGARRPPATARGRPARRCRRHRGAAAPWLRHHAQPHIRRPGRGRSAVRGRALRRTVAAAGARPHPAARRPGPADPGRAQCRPGRPGGGGDPRPAARTPGGAHQPARLPPARRGPRGGRDRRAGGRPDRGKGNARATHGRGGRVRASVRHPGRGLSRPGPAAEPSHAVISPIG